MLRHLGFRLAACGGTTLVCAVVMLRGNAPPSAGAMAGGAAALLLLAVADSVRRTRRDLADADEAARLRLDADRFASLAEILTSAVFELDDKCRLIYVNERAAEITGYPREDLAGGFDGVSLFNQEHEERFRSAFAKLMTEGQACNSEFTGLRSNCGEFPARLRMVPVRRGDRIVGARGIFADVTDQKESEKLLMESFSEMVNLLESIPSILIGIDDKLRITKWNKAAERAFGVVSWDVTDSPLRESGAKWDWSVVGGLVEDAVRQRQALACEHLPYVRSDGEAGLLNMTVTPLSDNRGQPAGALILCTDTTERERLESALDEASKLESIATLVQGIAREINTPTQFIGDSLAYLDEAFGDVERLLDAYTGLEKNCGRGKAAQSALAEVKRDKAEMDIAFARTEIPKAVEQSLAGMTRITEMVNCMLEFSRAQSAGKMLADVNTAIRNCVGLSRNEWKYAAELECDLAEDLPPIYCHIGEINNLLLNLITNAVRAIKSVEGGKLADKGRITIITRSRDEGVEILVGDTGAGIPDEILPRIFEPRFTTRTDGVGSGQKLSSSRAIVEEMHHGELAVDTEVGKGTTFSIRLPRGDSSTVESEAAPAAGGVKISAVEEPAETVEEELPSF